MKTLSLVLWLGVAATVYAEGFVPRDVTVSAGVRDILDWLFSGTVVQLGGLSALVVAVVQLLKVALVTLGTRLKGRWAFIATAAVSAAAAVVRAASDGELGRGDWTEIVTALIVFVMAAAGYRLLFSSVAKEQGVVRAACTVFR